MGKPKVDWATVRQEYVNSPRGLTKQSLADKYGVRIETVVRKATKEKWDFDRERFLMRLAEQTSENKAVAVANEGKTFDSDSLKFAKKGLALADKYLDDKGLDPRVMKDVLTAGRTAQQIAKDALGDKPEATVTVEGKLSLSLEQVIEEYADAIGAVPEADRP